MSAELEMVREFHVMTGHPVLPRPGVPPNDRVRLRAKLIMEECMETCRALLGLPKEQTNAFVRANNQAIDMELDPKTDLVEVADGLADVIYVAYGCALEMGIPIDRVFREVHFSNMKKQSGATREDGKITKPAGWQPPDIGSILNEYM